MVDRRHPAQRARAGDQVLVFLAGHGSQQPQSVDATAPELDGQDEAAHALRCPVSSLCSTRAGSLVSDQIGPHGHRRGPYGEANTVYVLRIVLDERLTPTSDGRGARA